MVFEFELCKWDLRKTVLSSESLKKFDYATQKLAECQSLILVIAHQHNDRDFLKTSEIGDLQNL